jgi:hypothetical protein
MTMKRSPAIGMLLIALVVSGCAATPDPEGAPARVPAAPATPADTPSEPAPPVSRPADDSAAFAWPPITRECRPWAYNWWPGSAVDEENLARELRRYRDGGLGGIHIIPIYGAKGAEKRYVEYLSPKWMALLRFAVEEADKLGLGVDMTTGTGWCFGGPGVSARDACARAKVETSRLAPGKAFTKKLDRASVEAAVAVAEDGRTVDLLALADDKGRVSWRPGPGQGGAWTVHVLTRRPSGRKVKRAAPGGAGYMVNPAFGDAMDRYLERFTKAFDAYDGPAPRAMYHDSYEYDTRWSPDVLGEFERRRGYRLQDRLADFMSKQHTDAASRVRSDFRETMSDMMIENAFPKWAAWCRERGMRTRNQAHGAPANLLDLYAVADVPETEMFSRGGGRDPRVSRFDEKFGEGDRSPLVSKFASSAAHVAGRGLVSAETGTWMAEHFCETLEELKCLVDLLFVSGVNHVIYHGNCYSPDDAAWPGWLFYASTEMNPRNSIWRDAPALNSYVARCQAVLQSGGPDSDILLYWPIHDLWSAAPRKAGDGTDLRHLSVHDRGWLAKQPMGDVAKTLWDGGWEFDYVSDRQLAAAKAKGGEVEMPGGAYRAVVVPPCERMPVATLERLLALAHEGCTIIFAGGLPRDVPGLARLDERRTRMSALLAPVAPEGGRPSAAGKLVVTSARYGAGETWIDVTSTVQDHVRGDRLSIKVDVPKPFRDPLVGTVKTLEVKYTLGGRAGRKSTRDRTTLVIGPTDAAPPVRQVGLGRGRVIVGGGSARALGIAGVAPESFTAHTGARFIRRRHADGRHYFIANQGMKLMDGWFALATPAASAVIMDPMTGRAGLAELRQTDGRAEVRLRVEPGHSIILRTFEARSVRGRAWPYLAPGGAAMEIAGPWRVRFIEGGPELPKEYETKELASWTECGDPEAERFAGGAVYRTTFAAPGGEGPWVLDLGEVCHSARVRLNGRDLGTLIMHPYCIGVEGLKPEGNVLEVEVTNLSANRIRDLDKRKVKWRIFHNINFVNIRYRSFDASKWPVFESGLLGPVVLRRAKETR